MSETKWTKFFDMSSGGGQKLEWNNIYIEAPEDVAVVVFYNRFGRSPNCVTCTCCGADYSISEYDALARATAYDRGCGTDNETGKHIEEKDTRYSSGKDYMTLKEYEKSDDVLIVRTGDIKDGERAGDVPEEGYVWK